MRPLLGALLVWAIAVTVASSGAATPESGLRKIGVLPIFPGDRVVVDGHARRLIVMSASAPLTLSVYEGDRYLRIKKVEFSSYWPQIGSLARPRIYAFDESARRLYVLAYTSQIEMENTTNPHLLTIDADSLELLTDQPLAIFPPGVRIMGMKQIEPGRAAVVGQAVADVSAPLIPSGVAPRLLGVVVAQVDLATARTTWGPVPARACEQPIATQSQAEAAVFGGKFFLGCATAQVLGFPAPGVPAVVAIDLADPTQQSVFFLPGSYGLGESYYDEGGHRLVLVGAAFGRPAQAVWVFDLDHRTFVGQTTAGETSVLGAGVNAETGRLYVGIEGAFLITSDRGLEIPQALQFDMEPKYGPIVTLPFNRRVIVPVRGERDEWVFTVFQDELTDNTFPPAKPLDYRTFDGLHTAEPQFAGDAQAFGLRIHEIGGINAVVQNVNPNPTNYWNLAGTYTGLRDGDRDLYFGRVERAHLSADEATAAATPAEPDTSTGEDYKTVARNVEDTPAGFSKEWPFRTAACNDFGSGATSANETGAAARCRLAEGQATGSATYGGLEIGGFASIGASASTAEIRLDPKLGIVADVHAEARNVSLRSSAQIGYMASDVRVAAFGRGGTARALYRRTFRNVTAGEFSCTRECDPSDVLTALSDALGVQIRVELPAAEVVRTSGGAHGHALRETWQHQQDVVINNQDPTELQVPALRVTYIGDNVVASRLILEFAATKADVTYIPLVAGRPPSSESTATGPSIDVGDLRAVRIEAPSGSGAPPAAGGALQRVVRVAGRPAKLLLTASLRSVALWALFAVPLSLAARRRHLLRLLRARS